jgi:hypothetical protein
MNSNGIYHTLQLVLVLPEVPQSYRQNVNQRDDENHNRWGAFTNNNLWLS